MNIEKIWNQVKADDDAEYAVADPDFKAKLGHAASEARQGRSTGIAGLEEFEEAIAKGEGATLSASGVDAARTDASAPTAVGDKPDEDAAEASPDAKGGKGSKAKALADAAGAGERVEASEIHSPSAPSAARPMAAEAPGNAPVKKAGVKKASAKKAATKTAVKKVAVKKSAKKGGK